MIHATPLERNRRTREPFESRLLSACGIRLEEADDDVVRVECLRFRERPPIVCVDLDVSYLTLLHFTRASSPSHPRSPRKREKKGLPPATKSKLLMRIVAPTGEKTEVGGTPVMSAPLDAPCSISLDGVSVEDVPVGSALELEFVESELDEASGSS